MSGRDGPWRAALTGCGRTFVGVEASAYQGHEMVWFIPPQDPLTGAELWINVKILDTSMGAELLTSIYKHMVNVGYYTGYGNAWTVAGCRLPVTLCILDSLVHEYRFRRALEAIVSLLDRSHDQCESYCILGASGKACDRIGVPSTGTFDQSRIFADMDWDELLSEVKQYIVADSADTTIPKSDVMAA